MENQIEPMDYRFKYELTSFDLWRLYMHDIYFKKNGIASIVFSVVMLILTMKFWTSANIFIRLLLIFGLSLYTVIQPILVYSRVGKQVKALPENMYIEFDRTGIHIELPSNTNIIKWKNVMGMKKMKSMLVLYSSNREGYILTDKALGKEKDEFQEYLNKKVKHIVK